MITFNRLNNQWIKKSEAKHLRVQVCW